MAYSSVFLADLKAGVCSSTTVEVRLLRFWETKNFKRGDELMGVDMLFIDSQATIMPATVNVNRLSTFAPHLKAGSLYSLIRFDVTRCNPSFRLTDSALIIRFTDSTRFTEITEAASTILGEGFRFRNHSELLGLANSNSQLPDIIGEITAVKSTVTNPPQDKERVMATIKLDNNVSVTLSLFDTQAVSFHKKLDGYKGDPRVVVASNINPKIVGGRLFLNATSATHIFFDKESNAGESYFYKLVSNETGNISAASLLKGYAKVEHITIAELNEFIITANSQDIEFSCTGKVTTIKSDKGWCYVSCSKCSKKLQRTVSSFTCMTCNNTNAVGVLRYRVELTIADDTSEAQFVCFDGEMQKLHLLRASEAGEQMAGKGENPEDCQPPPFIADMVGKSYKFQVRVTSYNFTAQHQTFTISRILNEHERLPLPEFAANNTSADNGASNSMDVSITATTPIAVDNAQETPSLVTSTSGLQKNKRSRTVPSNSNKKARDVDGK